MRTGRRGRPRKVKEERDHIGLYVPMDLGNRVRAEAEARGLTVSDYVGGILAEAHGMTWTVRTPPRPHDDPELLFEQSA